MKLLQTYYTSCQIGQTGSSGFQFYSFSGGITETELNEIGKLGSYKAPYGSTSYPTEDEVLNVLPVAFKYFKLSSGRVGALQSTACTQEYTGRPGNFFTHALVLEKGEFPFLPILLHKSEYFRHDLTDEQKNIQSIPPLLPPLSINESNLASARANWDNFHIKQFIEQGNNEELLSKLLDIILNRKEMNKKIIIADNKPERIIYTLSKALPFENAANLTFSTYSLQPSEQNVVLSASRYEGSDFNFEDASMRFSNYIFNNENGKYAELENQSEFSKILIHLLASEPQKINELYDYSAHFTGEKDIKAMGLIASVFSKQNFTSKWKQILPFVTDKAKPEYIKTFLNEYENQIAQLAGVLQEESEIILFIENMLRLIHRLQDTSEWLSVLFSCYQSIIVKRLDSSTKLLIDFNKRLLAVFKGTDRKIIKEQFTSYDTFLSLSKQAHTELAIMNVFTLFVSSVKILASPQKVIGNLLSMEEITWFINNIDEDQISSESFHALISEISDETGMLLLNISRAKSDNLVKRFVHELANEKNNTLFYEIILQGVFDHFEISSGIRNEIVRLLEDTALTHIPTTEELKVYDKIKSWENYIEGSAVGLILMGKNSTSLINEMKVCVVPKKLPVFLEWKRNELIEYLKRPEKWALFYSLSEKITPDILNKNVEKYFEQANDSTQLTALIVFSYDKKNRQMDDLLRKILAVMKRSVYNTLKHEMEQRADKVSDYFMSLNKGMSLKRLFNFKF